MPASIYKQTKLVQLTPAGKWYVAIPLLTLLELQAALGQNLHQALTTSPAREETLYAEHDLIAQGLQSRLTRANWGTP